MNLSGQIPQGHLKRPHAAELELQIIENPHVAFDIPKIAPDKKGFMA
jgi:hypothetical protein